MIKNERQYRITKAQAANFRRALDELRLTSTDQPPASDLEIELEDKALKSQLADLETDLREYENLLAGNAEILEVTSFDQLPTALIKARIARGMTQQQLAVRLGLKEQQVQRYEATEYAGANLQRIRAVLDALEVNVRNEIFLSTARGSTSALFGRLADVGLSKRFVLRRLLPPDITNRLASGMREIKEDEILALRAASLIGRVFGWSAEQIFGKNALLPRAEAIAGVKYKKPKTTSIQKTNAYTVYAQYLALLTLSCCTRMTAKSFNLDASEIRNAIVSSQGSLNLEAIVRFLWDLGIAVLPLKDTGTFHGAFWRAGGRNVIVIKQNTASEARWIIDLLHELFHAGRAPDQPESSVVEEQESLMAYRSSDVEEQNATAFAINVALGSRTEELFDACTTEAKGKVEWLKKAVPRVAARSEVDPAILANCLAYRLSYQDVNWWPTAAGFQHSEVDPWVVVRDIFLEKIDVGCLNEIDKQIFMAALSED